jgi:hypothetical protein
MQRHLVFGHPRPPRRLDAGRAADVGDAGHSVMWAISSADLIMRRRMEGAAMSTNSTPGTRPSAGSGVDVDVVELDPQPLDAAGQLADGVEVVVLLPVGVGDVVPPKVRRQGWPPSMPALIWWRLVVIDEEGRSAAEVAEHEVA